MLATLLACLPVVAPAADPQVAGHGSTSYRRPGESDEACADALRRAVEDALHRALASKLTREQMEQYDPQIRTSILPIAQTIVASWTVVDQRDEDRTCEVTISARVDEAKLRENLDLIGFSMDVKSRRSVAVLIDEYFANDIPPTNEPMVSSVTERTKSDSRHDVEVPGYLLTAAGQKAAAEVAKETPPATPILPPGFGPDGSGPSLSSDDYYESKRSKEFQERIVEYFPREVIQRPRTNPVSAASVSAALLARDVRLLDAGQVAGLRARLVGADGMLLSTIADPATLSTRATQAGAMIGADAMMIGTTAIIYSGDVGGQHKAEATLALRVVDTTTGDIVGYATFVEKGMGGNSEAAASAAAQRVGDAVGAYLGEQLFQYWKSRDEKGVEIQLNLVGVTSTRLSLTVSDALAQVKGAEDIEQRVFDRTSGVMSFTLTTKEPLGAFKSSVLRALYAIPELAGMEDEASIGSNWNLVVH
jgi:hypothetical protein